MPATVRRLSTYRFRQTDRLLFDANVWLFLFSPQYAPDDRRVRVYSAGARSVLAAHSKIFIDPLVMSEFINAWARFEYNKLPTSTKPNDFKSYRNSPGFRPVARAIADACRRILQFAMRVDCDFAALDMDALLNGYAAGRVDFNDQVLGELCRRKKVILVTHDIDLKGLAPSILTENRRLLT
ncbi:MAG: PIN domain-containing protein [Candidatus Binatia bacterium]